AWNAEAETESDNDQHHRCHSDPQRPRQPDRKSAGFGRPRVDGNRGHICNLQPWPVGLNPRHRPTAVLNPTARVSGLVRTSARELAESQTAAATTCVHQPPGWAKRVPTPISNIAVSVQTPGTGTSSWNSREAL